MIFNRVDIANSLGIFSSIIISDMFFSSRLLSSTYRLIGKIIFVIYFGCSSLAIIDGFENTYFLKRSWRIKISSIQHQINEKVGRYCENVLVIVNELSSLSQQMSYTIIPSPYADLSHYNAYINKDEFYNSKYAKLYNNESFNNFSESKNLKSNFHFLVSKNLDTSINHFVDKEYDYTFYIDENDNIKRIF